MADCISRQWDRNNLNLETLSDSHNVEGHCPKATVVGKKHRDQRQLEEERDGSVNSSTSPRIITSGTQLGWEPGARSGYKDHQVVLISGLFLVACSVYSLQNLGLLAQDDTLHNDVGPPTSITNLKNILQVSWSYRGSSSTEVPSSLLT